ANAHSHAFHRALRGRAHVDGTFWSWRDLMYTVADRLDPDNYHRLARAVYAEMVLAGMTCVGEFHYVHHSPTGRRYSDPNAMGAALVAAATDAGIRLTLLDTCYLRGGFGRPLEGVQRRFGDGDVLSWMDRADTVTVDTDSVRRGAALHSVRAVPGDAIRPVAAWAAESSLPLHMHLSEQRAENEACLSEHGRTPTEVLDSGGALGPATTAVHATHLAPGDIALLGGSGTGVCLCPTTEADLADGIGPAAALAVAGSPLSIGSDGHSVIDPFAEAGAVESHMRLATGTRGSFGTADLVALATGGHRALGWQDAGSIAAGTRGDLVTVSLESPVLAGVPPEEVFAVARRADVREVIVDGRPVVSGGVHQYLPDVAVELRAAVDGLWNLPARA
ncbi:MAG: formimidoylglutamate deiminase, partial [Sciscionella sp.]